MVRRSRRWPLRVRIAGTYIAVILIAVFVLAWFELSVAGQLVSAGVAATAAGLAWWRNTRPALPRASVRPGVERQR